MAKIDGGEMMVRALEREGVREVFTLHGGRLTYPGTAIVVHAWHTYEHWYAVRFKNEKVTRVHFINPDWQKNPERSFALLREFLLTGALSPFDDFCPDEPTGRCK